MTNSFTRFVLTTAFVFYAGIAVAEDHASPPLKVLLIAGGCCHDYAAQTESLKKGIEQRTGGTVTVVFNSDKSTEAKFEIYESDDWAKGYDVVIHDECSANVTEQPYVERILAAHRNGVPAVNLHCAMHSYRWGEFREPVQSGADNAAWYEMIGVQSNSHGKQTPIDVAYQGTGHSVLEGLDDWKTINEELYNNVRVFGSTEVLATGTQANAKGDVSKAAVVWTNLYGPNKTKIFSTTLGHNNDTVSDDRYLDLVTRGLLWTTGRLSTTK